MHAFAQDVSRLETVEDGLGSSDGGMLIESVHPYDSLGSFI